MVLVCNFGLIVSQLFAWQGHHLSLYFFLEINQVEDSLGMIVANFSHCILSYFEDLSWNLIISICLTDIQIWKHFQNIRLLDLERVFNKMFSYFFDTFTFISPFTNIGYRLIADNGGMINGIIGIFYPISKVFQNPASKIWIKIDYTFVTITKTSGNYCYLLNLPFLQHVYCIEFFYLLIVFIFFWSTAITLFGTKLEKILREVLFKIWTSTWTVTVP